MLKCRNDSGKFITLCRSAVDSQFSHLPNGVSIQVTEPAEAHNLSILDISATERTFGATVSERNRPTIFDPKK